MTGAIGRRFARYHANTGSFGVVWSLLLIALLGYRVANSSSVTVRVVLGGLLLISLVLGWLIIPIARWKPSLASRLISILNWGVIGLLLADLTGLVAVHPLAWLVGICVLVWTISAGFWFVSEPYIMTPQGQKKWARQARREAIRDGRIEP